MIIKRNGFWLPSYFSSYFSSTYFHVFLDTSGVFSSAQIFFFFFFASSETVRWLYSFWELDCTMLRQTKYLYAKNINKIENGLLWTRVTLASVTFSKDKVVEYRLQRHKACSTPHNLLLCAVCFWVRISSNPNLNVWCAFTFSDIFRVVFVLCGCTYLCVCMWVFLYSYGFCLLQLP